MSMFCDLSVAFAILWSIWCMRTQDSKESVNPARTNSIGAGHDQSHISSHSQQIIERSQPTISTPQTREETSQLPTCKSLPKNCMTSL